jgi:cell division septum initiation protein DivIVA
MNIREISKPVTAKSLNESLAKRFGQKINIDAFTIEQLEDVRNKIRTKLSQVEMNENFDSVIKNENYQKSKLFLDVLNTAIAEREESVEEAAKPDFLDMDKDGDKKEPMKKAIKDKKNKKNEAIVKEGAEDAAELVMAAKDMVDRVTGWMEDTAEMQTESMLELADAIRDEMGSEKSEAFTASIKPALEAMYGVMETTRVTLTNGVGMLTGEEAAMAPDALGADPLDDPLPADPEMEPLDDDGLGAADAAMGGEEEAGREKRESVQRGSKKKLAERSRRIATTLSKKKS